MPKTLQTRKRPSKLRVPGRARELALVERGFVVAGVDEVGRGAWAGPVVAGAVVLNPHRRLYKVRDSKLVAEKDRAALAARIIRAAEAFGIGVVGIEEINQFGLAWAIRQSGVRAVADLGNTRLQVLLDGSYNYFPADQPCQTIVGGDASELCIAAASVIAKAHRDALLRKLDAVHPGYGLARNKGYGTRAHRTALTVLGVSPVHRRTYRPISLALQREVAVPLWEA